ncbi:MAG: hypothetical protein QHH24_04460 [Candidatus Bathyarchaeota archaeon]|jgi:hypothetical protein|nr:hypothetical protein [Candidatus Bathyarchaeota archaeon]
MSRKKARKTLIEPKVRLLLWIRLHGERDQSNYLAKLAKKIDYSEGSLSTLLNDLLAKGFIESLNPDQVSPPYRTTNEAKEFLEPIFLVRKIGYIVALITFLASSTIFWYHAYAPDLLFKWWLPVLVISFSPVVILLILYPNFILEMGKSSYSKAQ